MWHGRMESNHRWQGWNLSCYHYTTPAYGWIGGGRTRDRRLTVDRFTTKLQSNKKSPDVGGWFAYVPVNYGCKESNPNGCVIVLILIPWFDHMMIVSQMKTTPLHSWFVRLIGWNRATDSSRRISPCGGCYQSCLFYLIDIYIVSYPSRFVNSLHDI